MSVCDSTLAKLNVISWRDRQLSRRPRKSPGQTAQRVYIACATCSYSLSSRVSLSPPHALKTAWSVFLFSSLSPFFVNPLSHIFISQNKFISKLTLRVMNRAMFHSNFGLTIVPAKCREIFTRWLIWLLGLVITRHQVSHPSRLLLVMHWSRSTCQTAATSM